MIRNIGKEIFLYVFVVFLGIVREVTFEQRSS